MLAINNPTITNNINIGENSTDPKKGKDSKNDEKVINREITINIKEEVRITGDLPKGQIPRTNIFDALTNNRFPDHNFSLNNTIDIIEDILKVPFHTTEDLITLTGKFTDSLSGSNFSQLLNVADHLRDILQNTDINDTVIGSLQKVVFNKITDLATTPIFPETGVNPVTPTAPSIPESNDLDKEISEKEMEWAKNLYDKVSNGYSPNSSEIDEYNKILQRQEHQQNKMIG